MNEHPDPDAYIDDIILGTLKRTLGVPKKSHLFVVAERTPHRHHREGGVHGLVDYVAGVIAQWPQRQGRGNKYPLTLATKATILGHTLRGETCARRQGDRPASGLRNRATVGRASGGGRGLYDGLS